MTELVRSIKDHEGFRRKSYRDSLGVWTIGYGHNMEVDPNFSHPYHETVITQTRALELLAVDILEAVEGCWRNGLIRQALLKCNANRSRVLYEMAYQLGVHGLAGFQGTLNHVALGDMIAASHEMLDSRWAEQTPRRAKELSERFQRG